MSKKVTLVFPGQGAQYVGMGKNLESFESFNLFKKANEVLGYDLSKLCFEGPEEDLKLTKNTQPAIVTHSIVLFNILKKVLDDKGVEIEQVLGHSVGEYAALTAAGALSFEDAVKAVHLRGKFMQEAVPEGKGAMYAIMKVPGDIIKKACEEASDDKKCMPANFNEPNQTVISGDAEACEKAVKWLEENYEGRFRAMPLKVSAPFHCSLMEPAQANLEKEFSNFTFKSNTIPYIANIDATKYDTLSPEKIQKNLVDQVTGSVLWTQSIEKLSNDTLCIEVGPGKVLTGLIKKINPEIKVLNLDQEDFIAKIEEFLS